MARLVQQRLWRAGALSALLGGVAALAAGAVLADQGRREFEVIARKYAYRVVGSPAPQIRVTQNDLVRITFSTEDIPHSFTVEDTQNSHYRIMKRAEPGKPVSFDFRADTAGTFRFFCSLTIDEGCRQMQGQLIVERSGQARVGGRRPAVATLLRTPAARPWAGD